jgi:hypothetical protein
LIDGGEKIDTVVSYSLLGDLEFTNVEVLNFAAQGQNLYASIAQISAFGQLIDTLDDASSFSITLVGSGGTLDFSTRLTTDLPLYFDGSGASPGLTLTGTAFDDILYGSPFNVTCSPFCPRL